MPDVIITIDEKEAHQALDHLAKLLSSAELASVLRTEVSPFLRHRTDMNFANQGTRSGGGWKELRPATEAIRYLEGFNPVWPINVRTGEMKNFLSEDPGSVRLATTSATLDWPGPASGDIEDKLQTAQHGRADPHTVPRPVIDFNNADVESVLAIFGSWLELGMAAGSFGEGAP